MWLLQCWTLKKARDWWDDQDRPPRQQQHQKLVEDTPNRQEQEQEHQQAVVHPCSIATTNLLHHCNRCRSSSSRWGSVGAQQLQQCSRQHQPCWAPWSVNSQAGMMCKQRLQRQWRGPPPLLPLPLLVAALAPLQLLQQMGLA